MSNVRQSSIAIAADLLAGFPGALHEAGLAVDPGRAKTFLAAANACRLNGIDDLARAGKVTLTSSPDDFPVFEAVFDAWFGESVFSGKVERPEEDNAPRSDRPRNQAAMPDIVDGEAKGDAASDEHLRDRKDFGRLGSSDRTALARLRRRLAALPETLSRSHRPSPLGRRIDLARTARAARRTFGETLRIMREIRPMKPRRLLLLIDVSGSMKLHSEIYLRFAQLVTRARPKVETFCFGTRLSRVTRTLKHRDPEEALARLSSVVFDFDGGTMIGASLENFLSASRHAALVRGAVVMVFSDGLERGDPARMIHATGRLARLSHRLIWVTPLAADPRYRPATRGMAGILPDLDGLFDGSSLAALERMLGSLDSVERMARGQAARQFTERRTAA